MTCPFSLLLMITWRDHSVVSESIMRGDASPRWVCNCNDVGELRRRIGRVRCCGVKIQGKKNTRQRQSNGERRPFHKQVSSCRSLLSGRNGMVGNSNYLSIKMR